MPVLDYLDTNRKFIDFTQNNIELINFCLSIDSSYRDAFNPTSIGSSAYLITNEWSFDKDTIKDICERIDKENSTHLAVSGHNKGDNKGVDAVVKKILDIDDFETRLKNENAELVNEIAKAVPEISKFSFASKFCTYVSIYKDKNPNAYSIYDKVISEILPYYEWKFLHTTEIHAKINRNKKDGNEKVVSTIENTFAKKGSFNYEGYNKLIGQIIEAINKEKKLTIDRLTFDRMLWYYYKGDEKLRQEALNEIPL